MKIDQPFFVMHIDHTCGIIMLSTQLALHGHAHVTVDEPAQLGWFLAEVDS